MAWFSAFLLTIVEVIYPYKWCLKKDFLEFVICWSGKQYMLAPISTSLQQQHHWWPFFVPLLGMGVPFFTWRKKIFLIFCVNFLLRGEAKYLDENLLILQHAEILRLSIMSSWWSECWECKILLKYFMTHPIIEKVFHTNFKFMNIRTIAYTNINKKIWISDNPFLYSNKSSAQY